MTGLQWRTPAFDVHLRAASGKLAKQEHNRER
jgi:hypothetical protein